MSDFRVNMWNKLTYFAINTFLNIAESPRKELFKSHLEALFCLIYDFNIIRPFARPLLRNINMSP